MIGAILVVLLAAFIGSVAQLLFKKVSNKSLKQLISNFNFWLALFFYGISTIMFIIALKFGEITILYPVVASSYFWTSILAAKYFHEKMDILKWIGLSIIWLGIIIIII